MSDAYYRRGSENRIVAMLLADAGCVYPARAAGLSFDRPPLTNSSGASFMPLPGQYANQRGVGHLKTAKRDVLVVHGRTADAVPVARIRGRLASLSLLQDRNDLPLSETAPRHSVRVVTRA
jgi:hypothetical protein